MGGIVRFVVIGWCVLVNWSCAGYKTRYAKNVSDWASSSADSERKPSHTMYLLGDAGNDSPKDRAPVLEYLKEALPNESDSSSILFLGDNIYERGMPPLEYSERRKVAEFRINSQLEILNGFTGSPIFIPGNHDWHGWGADGLKRQEVYVKDYISKLGSAAGDINYFLPENGCAGPVAVELNNQIVLIVIDSQRWLSNWKGDEKDEQCAITSREAFQSSFKSLLEKYSNKKVVVAMHHPPYTYGPHGGRYSFRQHFFPLTDLKSGLYIPLPVLGSLAVLFRSTIGSLQDVPNKQYKALRRVMLESTEKHGAVIFVSGHEHTLQFIEDHNKSFIVSGSGSKRSPVGSGKGSLFSSAALGYATLQFFENGETWVHYKEVVDNGKTVRTIFRRKISGTTFE